MRDIMRLQQHADVLCHGRVLPPSEGALRLETDRTAPALIFVVVLHLALPATSHERGSVPSFGSGLCAAAHASSFCVRCGIFTGAPVLIMINIRLRRNKANVGGKCGLCFRLALHVDNGLKAVSTYG